MLNKTSNHIKKKLYLISCSFFYKPSSSKITLKKLNFCCKKSLYIKLILYTVLILQIRC